ncbi:DUF4126 domain-containing protein [Imtechella halotolerans]|uniref:DUF4126 domain-containing protein n=1 Tax=Imtechella halotolerans K1 TaxID=946077 RepID=I0WG33_9FLAO|nr:DUF4126 domain-containing protein [Imtechella halotolerans]EID75349.1 hypothetical protein W5A_06291 [Imtechella halotolerans K1]WMQ63723.1 DUF4126 domain-containing protein [Imtechella halotolerans]
MTTETILSIFLGVSLAASVGFRVFLPLFVLSIASYTGMWELNENWDWLGSLPALITLGVAMILEIGAYFIPWVDTVLDAIAIPLAAIAGTAVMVSTVADLSPMVTWVLAIVAGGGTATAIKGATTTTRLTSTATTGGLANPVVSTIETGTATAISLAAIVMPMLAAAIVVIILVLVFRFYRKIRPRRNE